jgi:hypothetical protein
MTLRVECPGCGRFLGEIEDKDSGITHRYCPECAARYREKVERDLADLDTVDAIRESLRKAFEKEDSDEG